MTTALYFAEGTHFGIIVTRLAWMAQRFVSSKRETLGVGRFFVFKCICVCPRKASASPSPPAKQTANPTEFSNAGGVGRKQAREDGFLGAALCLQLQSKSAPTQQKLGVSEKQAREKSYIGGVTPPLKRGAYGSAGVFRGTSRWT